MRSVFREIIPVVAERAPNTQRVIKVFHTRSQFLRFGNAEDLEILRRIYKPRISFWRLTHSQ